MTIANRVLARFKAADAPAGDVWLPNYLGSRAGLVDRIIKGIKLADKGIHDANDLKAPAGGVCYFLLKAVHEAALAEKLWKFFDQNAGLSGDAQWEDLASRVVTYLPHTQPEKRLAAGGFCVALLAKTRQVRKADRLNWMLQREFAQEIKSAPLPEKPVKVKPKTPTQVFVEWVNSPDVAQAVQVAKDLPLDKAAALVWYVLEDCNAHTASSTAEMILSPLVQTPVEWKEVHDEMQAVSSILDFGVIGAAAFGVALMRAKGANGPAKSLASAMVKEFAEYLTDDL